MTPDPDPKHPFDPVPDNPEDLTPEQRAAFVGAVQAQLSEHAAAIRTLWDALAAIAADPETSAEDRSQAASEVLHDIERLGYAMQFTWQTLGATAGLGDRHINAIEKGAIEAEGRAMDEAAGD